MMFHLSLKTNASLVCLLLLSSAPMALSSNVTGNDSETQEITNNTWSPLETANAPDGGVAKLVMIFEKMSSSAPRKVSDSASNAQKRKLNAALNIEVLNQPHLLDSIFDLLDLTDLMALLCVSHNVYQTGAHLERLRNLKTYFTEGFPKRLRTLFSSDDTSPDDLLSFCERRITAVFPLLRKLPQSNHDSHFKDFRALFSTEDNKAEDYYALLKYCSHYTDFILKTMSDEYNDFMIQTIRNITDPEIRELFVNKGSEIFTTHMNTWEILDTIKAIEKISLYDKLELLENQAYELSGKDMSDKDKADTIKALKDIPSYETLELFLNKTSELFTESMRGQDRIFIIDAFKAIPKFKIKQRVLEYAPAFFKEEMPGWVRAKIIEALGNIPFQTLKLLMAGWDKADFTKALDQISDPQTLELFLEKVSERCKHYEERK